MKKPEIPFGVVTQTSYQIQQQTRQEAPKRRKVVDPVDFTSEITSEATAAGKNNQQSAFSEIIVVSDASKEANINRYTIGTCNSSKLLAGKFSTKLRGRCKLVNRPQLQIRSVT
jgi:hypothetical protein